MLAGLIAIFPMRWLGNAIVGSYDQAITTMFRPLPRIFDGPFFFAYIGLVVKLRPRLLLFLMIGHALVDLSTWAVYFSL